jgi:UDP-3-O-[3-hydroxymyristoyl] glucosamine N-acyltransferase
MTAGALAALVKGELVGDAQANIRGVGSLTGAKPGDLVYVEAEKDLPTALASPASAVLVGSGAFIRGKTIIRVAHPKWAFAQAAAALQPEPRMASGRHPTAIVHPSARLDQNVSLGPYVECARGVRLATRRRLVYRRQRITRRGVCAVSPCHDLRQRANRKPRADS